MRALRVGVFTIFLIFWSSKVPLAENPPPAFRFFTKQQLYMFAHPTRRRDIASATKQEIVDLHLYGCGITREQSGISYAVELLYNDIAFAFPNIFDWLIDEAAKVKEEKELQCLLKSLRRHLEVTRCSNITPKSLERLAAIPSKQSASVDAVSFSELAKEFSSRCEWHKANPKVEQPWEKYYRWRYEE
jgi:hypothetical protein